MFPDTTRGWRGFGWLLAAVFALALAARLVYGFEIRDLPTQHELVMDAQRYDALARDVLDHGWRPREPFSQAPLYPYLLAAVYAVSGRSLAAMRLAQAVLGALTAVLAAVAAARLFAGRGQEERQARSAAGGGGDRRGPGGALRPGGLLHSPAAQDGAGPLPRVGGAAAAAAARRARCLGALRWPGAGGRGRARRGGAAAREPAVAGAGGGALRPLRRASFHRYGARARVLV